MAGQIGAVLSRLLVVPIQARSHSAARPGKPLN
jgi:hypothetical protein